MMRQKLPPKPDEMTDEQRIAALESELLILKPYASTKGLALLKLRIGGIERALYRLRGFPLEENK